MEPSTFYFKNVNDRHNYRAIFKLISIDGRVPVSPKVGEILYLPDMETMVCNGCRIILEPMDNREEHMKDVAKFGVPGEPSDG